MIIISQLSLPRETSSVISIGLKDSTSVKFAEDYVKLSVADSTNLFPAKVGWLVRFPFQFYFLIDWGKRSRIKILSSLVGFFSYFFFLQTIFSVGDIICFDSPLSSTSNWYSSDERVLSIDRTIGKSIFSLLIFNFICKF